MTFYACISNHLVRTATDGGHGNGQKRHTKNRRGAKKFVGHKSPLVIKWGDRNYVCTTWNFYPHFYFTSKIDVYLVDHPKRP